VELLGPLATVAFQTISGLRPPQNAVDKNGKPLKIDSCYAYAADGEMVKERWSEFYEEKKQ
jgi:hypothetical protein